MDSKVEFAGEALDVLTAVESLLAEARAWAESGEWLRAVGARPNTPRGNAEYSALVRKIDEMERSWRRGLVAVLVSSSRSGHLTIEKAGAFNLSFEAPGSDCRGRLTYQPLYFNGHCVPVGRWSMKPENPQLADHGRRPNVERYAE